MLLNTKFLSIQKTAESRKGLSAVFIEERIKMIEKIITTRDYLSKSNLPASDYVINPYVGCTHGCRYCYACFMKRFTNHSEPWGEFIDIKLCDKTINIKKLAGKSLFLSSVTDCYNQYEEKYCITRKILEQLISVDCEITIATKSKLILRDIDLLKQCKNLKVAISINTLDENFKNDMDRASSIKDRIDTLKELHNNGIYTVLFMSPIFPGITDFKAIIENSSDFVNQYWFENLNLRGSYKQDILDYINQKYPQLNELYSDIYIKGDKSYWLALSAQIEGYCNEHNLNYINYFYHEDLVKEKLNSALNKRK